MASFTVEEIKKATDGNILQTGSMDYCTGVSTDTRTIEPGSLFIALKGERFDGHKFLTEACDKGAAVLLVSQKDVSNQIPSDVSVICVKDTKQGLEDLAHFYRMKFSIPVIAVTGSNGKTTTKDMITLLLETKYHVCATKKNFNNEIGLSMTLLSMTPDTEVCVVEMGMRGLGQIAELCRIASPTIGVVTNVGTSHIGILGNKENIAKAKAELIESLPDDGVAILNEDDPYVIAMGNKFKGNIIGYGVHGKYVVSACDIQYQSTGTKYMCTCFDEAFRVKLSALGIHHIYDALAATAAARVIGVDVKKIQKALAEFSPGAQRQGVTQVKDVLIMDDSYNANPLSMEMAFHSLKQLNASHYFLLLGDMGELGKFSEKLHFETGKKAAEIGFDGLITVGPLSVHLAEGAKAGGMKQVYTVSSCDEVIPILTKLVHAGDAVLLKGSHAMHMEKIPELWKEYIAHHGD